ncbi:MAG: virulence factor [Arenicella sp.]|nr:virulence factor [Arenicella sp.]
MVKGKVGRKRVRRALPGRFMEAIDAAAMRSGDSGSDDYLQHWKPSQSFAIEGDAEQCLDKVVADLEQEFPRERLLAMIKNGGWTAEQ